MLRLEVAGNLKFINTLNQMNKELKVEIPESALNALELCIAHMKNYAELISAKPFLNDGEPYIKAKVKLKHPDDSFILGVLWCAQCMVNDGLIDSSVVYG